MIEWNGWPPIGEIEIGVAPYEAHDTLMAIRTRFREARDILIVERAIALLAERRANDPWKEGTCQPPRSPMAGARGAS